MFSHRRRIFNYTNIRENEITSTKQRKYNMITITIITNYISTFDSSFFKTIHNFTEGTFLKVFNAIV